MTALLAPSSWVGLVQVVHDLAVGGIVALMLLHDVGEGVHIGRLGKGLDGLQSMTSPRRLKIRPSVS